MSIKMLAVDLYRAQKKVHQLEEELASAPVNQQDAINAKLREAKEDLRQLRNMLEGAKSPLPFRTRFTEKTTRRHR